MEVCKIGEQQGVGATFGSHTSSGGTKRPWHLRDEEKEESPSVVVRDKKLRKENTVSFATNQEGVASLNWPQSNQRKCM